MTETDEPEDIVTILKKKIISEKDTKLEDIHRRSDVSQIYLFFDYDRHNSEDCRIPDEEIQKMLDFFDDETSDYGKLYISYPMVESIYYFKTELPDNNYYTYTSKTSLGRRFKEKVNKDSHYKNLDFLAFKTSRKKHLVTIPSSNIVIDNIKQNWLYLLELNVKKANYICSNVLDYPENKEAICSKEIFKNQLIKYVNRNQEVSILNSFPLFLYEYKKC